MKPTDEAKRLQEEIGVISDKIKYAMSEEVEISYINEAISKILDAATIQLTAYFDTFEYGEDVSLDDAIEYLDKLRP